MERPTPKPKYILKGPRTERVKWLKYSRDEEQGLTFELVEEDKPCWMLYIPHGKDQVNSIRITSKEQLRELGLDEHRTPLYDPQTGETVGFQEDYHSLESVVSRMYGPEPVLEPTKVKKGAE